MAKRKGFAGLIFLLLLLAGLGAAAFLLFRDMDSPEITLSPELDIASPNIEFTARASDRSSNIKSITVTVRKDARTVKIAEETFSAKAPAQEIRFKIQADNIDSSFELEIQAVDDSMAGFGRGNRGTKTYNMRMDLTPPRLSLKNPKAYVMQGGTGCIIYSANKELARSGVKVGDLFFPGFRQPNGLYVCFFAFPYNVPFKEYSPVLIGVDRVENASQNKLDVTRLPKKFKADTIKLSDSFIENKVDEFSRLVPTAANDLERFLTVNGKVRAENVAQLLEIGRETAPEMLWRGSFVTLPNAATRAGFADNRTYSYNGQNVDNQTHLGLDYASLAHSPIPASNDGKVIFADYLGIYGNLVIIDHGMNLQTLYSHMSEIHVVKGQDVKRGEIIGKTGATGMAGGDHLHFGVLIAGQEVNPLEWIDNHWIKDKVTDPITQAGASAPPLVLTE